jgi:hypothetical protein
MFCYKKKKKKKPTQMLIGNFTIWNEAS